MHDVNCYEIVPNDASNILKFPTKNKIERIIRIIPIKDKNTYKSNNILGVITINITNIDYNNLILLVKLTTGELFVIRLS